MELHEIIDWAKTLPTDFCKFKVVHAEVGNIDDTEYTYRLDKPITSLSVDEETNEILFLSDEQLDQDQYSKIEALEYITSHFTGDGNNYHFTCLECIIQGDKFFYTKDELEEIINEMDKY